MRTQVPARRKRGPRRAPAAVQRHTAPDHHHLPARTKRCDRELAHAPTRSAKARNRDLGVDRRLVVRHDPTTQDAPTETDTAGGVPVDRENAPAPDARGAMGLPESKVGSINDRFITDR